MDWSRYVQEGKRLRQVRNSEWISSVDGLRRAAAAGEILEARAVRCDANRNLIIDLGNTEGIIPYPESAIGAESGTLRDIAVISLVGKPVCFKVISIEDRHAVLSRRAAQEEAMAAFMHELRSGDVIPVRITHLEPFGGLCGYGLRDCISDRYREYIRVAHIASVGSI